VISRGGVIAVKVSGGCEAAYPSPDTPGVAGQVLSLGSFLLMEREAKDVKLMVRSWGLRERLIPSGLMLSPIGSGNFVSNRPGRDRHCWREMLLWCAMKIRRCSAGGTRRAAVALAGDVRPAS
jgi:hypothetical protein